MYIIRRKKEQKQRAASRKFLKQKYPTTAMRHTFQQQTITTFLGHSRVSETKNVSVLNIGGVLIHLLRLVCSAQPLLKSFYRPFRVFFSFLRDRVILYFLEEIEGGRRAVRLTSVKQNLLYYLLLFPHLQYSCFSCKLAFWHGLEN